MKESKEDNHSVKESKEMRKIRINSSQNKEYADNTIKTAKYNIFTFLPFAVLYQFNNYFNIYFLFTAIILAIKEISPLDPGSAIAPFIIVIAISVIREGIEDVVSRLIFLFEQLIILKNKFYLLKKFILFTHLIFGFLEKSELR
jgi:hypothetical protein